MLSVFYAFVHTSWMRFCEDVCVYVDTENFVVGSDGVEDCALDPQREFLVTFLCARCEESDLCFAWVDV